MAQAIARMKERIAFQKRTVLVDAYRNHSSSWETIYSCFAYASTYAQNESGNEVIDEEREITFEVRYCPELAGVSSTGYRVSFRNEAYNILSVDMMNYQGKTIRFKCRKETRQ